ncbi:oxygen-insensitive NADPH nitroreductase [Peribacillus glennii]|uniref:Oxygen-insensitive NADPH nitroreductase n=1 Tax=Peribacillus glennii TaxID=2303991 RepID=A0A372LAU2_9BACI|nr:oxygen-insensitive NADPH nitroreductase [Peribacillus glennii]RFU61983.1 oxygen-insensitive NADPH nitroreductase [Peribacillus glennii]
MNEVIERILNHRSIRSFEDKPLTEDQIHTIIESAQAASSSSFIQAYTIIGVTDRKKKAALAQVAGSQEYVEKNGHLFVFCADLHRHDVIAEMENKDLGEPLESTEKFMVACIDAALAAQNASLAAESMGLGICYIGGIRNDLPAVSEILQIPTRVVPLFGLTVGYPEKITDKKPRLPLTNVYHINGYQQEKDTFIAELREYNDIVSRYYLERTGGKRADTWTGQIASMLEKKSRMYMKEFVEKQGLNKR